MCIRDRIKSEGDLNQITPLYDFGVSGVFTKSLDQALLNDKIDIAVHSLKDVPINLAKGIEIPCVFERANPYDVLVIKKRNLDFNSPLTIATSKMIPWTPHQNLALKMKNWVLIPPYKGSAVSRYTNVELGNSKDYQLYNLNDDPSQKTNLKETEKEKFNELLETYTEIINN